MAGKKTLSMEQVDACFKREHQAKVLVALYRLVYPEWDKIDHVVDWPKCGPAISHYVMARMMVYDREHHPNVWAGGAWMNSGWSRDETLKDWQVEVAPVTMQGETNEKNDDTE